MPFSSTASTLAPSSIRRRNSVKSSSLVFEAFIICLFNSSWVFSDSIVSLGDLGEKDKDDSEDDSDGIETCGKAAFSGLGWCETVQNMFSNASLTYPRLRTSLANSNPAFAILDAFKSCDLHHSILATKSDKSGFTGI